MKYDLSKMMRIFQSFRKAVFYRIILQFFLKRSKHPIPDNKNHSHIFIKIPYVAGMMNTVMGGAYKNSFKPGGHFINVLRVYKYPIYLGE